jgi:hypothetical protein
LKRCLVLVSGLLGLATILPATASAAVNVVSCPFENVNSGDYADRGFYVTDYQGTNLDTVTLGNTQSVAGAYTITMTARGGTYDGPIVGTSTVMTTLPDTETRVNFPFGGAPVARGSTITFAFSSTGPGLFAYDVGVGPCPGVTQTNGTTPPLDSFRRDSVGLTITQVPSNDFTYTLSGKSLLVGVSFPGTVRVSDAASPLGASTARKKRRLLLKPSRASGSPPTIKVPLLLAKAGKLKLRQKGKVTVNAKVTFTPDGGTAKTQTALLRIKGKRKR